MNYKCLKTKRSRNYLNSRASRKQFGLIGLDDETLRNVYKLHGRPIFSLHSFLKGNISPMKSPSSLCLTPINFEPVSLLFYEIQYGGECDLDAIIYNAKFQNYGRSNL
jgi:hypothetical protein